MFSGIVQAVGSIVRAATRGDGLRLTVAPGGLDLADVAVGDSIAVNGVCLTVVAGTGRQFEAEVSAQTIACTTGFAGGQRVNLEKALRLADRLGGHLMSGHVDGTGKVARFAPEGESRRLVVDAPRMLARYIARKGSIAIDGVSLTVNAVADRRFEVNLIPHTLAHTTLSGLDRGTPVNLEVDLLARYAERLMGTTARRTRPAPARRARAKK